MPPDPFAEDTFRQCRLDWGKLGRDAHRDLFGFYKFLIRLRKEHPALANRAPQAASVRIEDRGRVIVWEMTGGGRRLTVLMNFSAEAATLGIEYTAGNGRILARSAFDEHSGYGFDPDDRVDGGGTVDLDFKQLGPEGSPAETAPAFLGSSGKAVAVAGASVESRALEPWGFLVVDSAY